MIHAVRSVSSWPDVHIICKCMPSRLQWRFQAALRGVAITRSDWLYHPEKLTKDRIINVLRSRLPTLSWVLQRVTVLTATQTYWNLLKYIKSHSHNYSPSPSRPKLEKLTRKPCCCRGNRAMSVLINNHRYRMCRQLFGCEKDTLP